jgi:hypothetical protein
VYIYIYNNKNYGIFKETNYYIIILIIYLYNTNITPTLNFFLELYIVTEFGLIVSKVYFIKKNMQKF